MAKKPPHPRQIVIGDPKQELRRKIKALQLAGNNGNPSIKAVVTKAIDNLLKHE